ncbi:MAG: DUF4003 family protein [Ruminococcus sp.]|nr:DUF4003 family protein [Ruminococcus sp.]
MNTDIRTLCSTFIQNRDTVKKVFSSDSSYIIPVSANIFSANGLMADTAKLEMCKKLIKKNEGVFSPFRGNVKSVLAAKLSASDDPEEKLSYVNRTYKMLTGYFGKNDYTALLSLIFADMLPEDETENAAVRGKAIFKLMKKDHPWLTSSEDCVMAGLMAMSEKTDTDLLEDAEECFAILKKSFSDKNALQTVSQVFALSDESAVTKTERFTSLFDQLRQAGKKYGKSYELSTLASVSLLSNNVHELCGTICEADDILSGQKGYTGVFGLDKRKRLMHAAMITADLYQPADNTNIAASASALVLIAAQEAAMCAAIVAATIAASTTYSN